MYTLSIEHPITDFPTWKQAFDRFADEHEAVSRPTGSATRSMISDISSSS